VDVAANDTDPDNLIDIETVQITVAPSNGTATANVDGTVDYTHDGSETLQDQFRYTISDLSGAVSNNGLVEIAVTPINDAPTAVDDVLVVAIGSQVVSNVLTNDTDPDDGLNPASLTIVTAPTEGTVVANVDGTVTYTHNGTPNYADAFSYTVQDLAGDVSNMATVLVEINDGSGTHMTEPFVPTNSNGQYCNNDAEVHWAYMGEMNFDDCQDLANRTGTQWYVGQSTNYVTGWIGDQDVGMAAVTDVSNWGDENLVSRSDFYSCTLGQFDERTAPTVFPAEQIHIDGQGRIWHYWDLVDQTASQAIAFANPLGARIINPNSVGLNGLARMTAPTHWCHASAEFNGALDCNSDNICSFMVGYYE